MGADYFLTENIHYVIISPTHPFYGRQAAIATMHDKQKIIAPILARWCGIDLNLAAGVNTDALGTFTGEIPRAGSMLDAARAKARLAIEISGHSIGLGSEGSFGPHPVALFLSSSIELMVLFDAKTNHEVVVQKRFQTNYDSIIIKVGQDVSSFLKRIGFPDHAVIVRPEQSKEVDGIYKGIIDLHQLDVAIRDASKFSNTDSVIIQTDMRAHLNPTRKISIKYLTKRLALRIARLCPVCRAPGFGLIKDLQGLPCQVCNLPTKIKRAELHGCAACSHQRVCRERSPFMRAEAVWCDVCNP